MLEVRSQDVEEEAPGFPLWLPFVGLVVPYVLVRGMFWANTGVLESHDSTSYLTNVRVFRSGNIQDILAMSPDATPFYPLMSAIFTLPGAPPDLAARLVSLSFSVLLLGVVLALVRHLGGSWMAAVGAGTLLVLSPALIPLSYAVITEPSYIATVYAGLLVLWLRLDRPTASSGALLGMIFAMAFLNRIEGLLFLAVIPVIQGLYILFHRERSSTLAGFIRWTLCFSLTFGTLAAPQVWRVSEQMGGFSINGRQAWTLLLAPGGEERPEQRLYGLDYSPAQINLEYIWRNPEARKELGRRVDMVEYSKHALFNLDKLNREYLSDLAGPVVLGMFAIGIAILLARRRYFDLLLIFFFLATALAAPLLQTNLLPRHVAVVAPMIFVGAGIGAAALVRLVPRIGRLPLERWVGSVVLLGLVLVSWFVPLFQAYVQIPNQRYDPMSLEEPVRILRTAAAEFGRPPVLATRQHYITYKARAIGIPLPFADYEELVEFLRLRNADFVFLEYGHLRDRAFVADFSGEAPPTHFSLLHRGLDKWGNKIELYRYRREPMVTATTARSIEGEPP